MIKPLSEAQTDIWNMATGPPSLFKLRVEVIAYQKCHENFEGPFPSHLKPPKILSLRPDF